MFRYIRIKIWLIIIIMSFSINKILAKDYRYNPNKKLHIEISKSGLNRISNPPYKISQVVGDESNFKLQHDEKGNNIYIIPVGKIGSSFEISLINDGGFVQDIEFI